MPWSVFRWTAIAVAFLAVTVGGARAECVDASVPKDAIIKRHGRWIALTAAQRTFLAGVYVVNPETAPGLPYGDSAALMQNVGDSGGVVVFIDAKKVCAAMPIPKAIIDMLGDVEANVISHAGRKL